MQSELQLDVKHEKDDELDLMGGRVRIVTTKKNLSSSGSSPEAQNITSVGKDGQISASQSYQRPTISTGRTAMHQAPTDHSPISPSSSSVTSPVHLQNLSAVRGHDPGPGTPAHYQTFTDAASYRTHVDRNAAQGAYTTAVHEYPQQVKLDEWVPPHAHVPVTAYSHPSRPEVGMDGMEYGHPHNANIGAHQSRSYASTHDVPLQRQQGFAAPAPYSATFTPPPGMTAHSHPEPFFPQGEPGPDYYGSAPRELSAMGLVAQHSGLNQRWTHFVQDSGVFYNQQ